MKFKIKQFNIKDNVSRFSKCVMEDLCCFIILHELLCKYELKCRGICEFSPIGLVLISVFHNSYGDIVMDLTKLERRVAICGAKKTSVR